MRLLSLVLVLTLALSISATALGQTSRIAALRTGIAWQRSQTWHYEDVAGVRHIPTNYAERYTRSLAYLRWIERRWNARRVLAKRQAARIPSGSVPTIICRVFGSAACPEALHIAWGESRYETWAANGQYLGLFQMGSGERATYATIGYATAYEQTVAAHNLYLARGWEPWTCCGE